MVLMASEQNKTTEVHESHYFNVHVDNSEQKHSLEENNSQAHHESFGELEIRSVAMSANIASSVCQEVNHLIRITSESIVDYPLPSVEIRPDLMDDGGVTFDVDTVCSFVLPPESVLLAIVLSRWDDIVGPQTVQMWLKKDMECKSSINYIENKLVCNHRNDRYSKNVTPIMKSVHYVTCHTVNCASVSATNSSSSMLIVPDLNMATISQLFHSQNHKDAPSVPFSLGVITSLSHCTFLHQRFNVVQNWIQRLTHHLLPAVAEEISTSKQGLIEVTPLILELNEAISSLHLVGLGSSLSYPININRNVLMHSSLPQALTSHLQTFGCTVVIGSISQEINNVIAFLSLFLNDDEKFSSMFVPLTGHNCFHTGLHLQGLLVDAFGYREISSLELAKNPYPVTMVDLTRTIDDGGVKQSPLYHQHIALQLEATNQSNEMPCVDLLPKSLLHPVKESSKLVATLLAELSVLPTEKWEKHVSLFKLKILNLTQLFISIIFTVSDLKGKLLHTTVQQFKKSLKLGDADFLLILAQCEKLKPGFFTFIMKDRSS